MTAVRLPCQIYRLYPEDEPGGDGVEMAIHYLPMEDQPTVLQPTPSPFAPLVLAGLNGYLIARRDLELTSDVARAITALYAGLGMPITVEQFDDEMREFPTEDTSEIVMLLKRARMLN